MTGVQDIMFLQKFDLKEDEAIEDEKYCLVDEESKEQIKIPIAKARSITALNDTQIAVQTNTEVYILNW